MTDFHSKRSGEQIESLLDLIANGKVGGGVYIAEFTIENILDMFSTEEPLAINKDALVAAVKENKIIVIPYTQNSTGGGYVMDVDAQETEIYFSTNVGRFYVEFLIYPDEPTSEITVDGAYMLEFQDYLVSGENIKTINGESILDYGDLELPTKEDLNAKADDSAVVHTSGDETIDGKKTFRGNVRFTESGDYGITFGNDTRIYLDGTNTFIFGPIRGSLAVGSQTIPLFLAGQQDRPKYNNAEMAMLSDVEGKQDTISDLDTIRSGAAKGATALQSVPSEYVTETELNNKGYATTSALNDKVDKVSGKQLSTEDFTSALKAKLEGLSNYDDTTLTNAISSLETRLNTLVSGDTSTAIESFNEIIAFLDGVTDSQSLDSIIASIEQQIAAKQDKITDLEAIRSGAAKGATALQSYTEKYTGTITGITMNGASKGTSGVVDLGTVITAHQDISGKADKSSLASVATSGSYNDLSNKPTIPAAVTESTVSGWGFTKNTGTYSKPSTGIPKSDLASAVQTSLGKADTALQSYTEQYKGTVTGVKVNGSTKSPSSGTVDIGNVVTSVKINGSSKSPSSGVVDLGTVITSHQDISGKQDKLVSGTNIKTINGTSILGSGNIVISGGGGSSSGSGAYAEVNHGTSDTTFTLTPNTFHVWDEVASLTLTLGSETAGVANEFLFQFTSGATATALTLPDDIKWTEELVIESNKIYQVSILKGLACVLSWDSINASALIENHITYNEGDFMNGGTITFEYPTASELTFNMSYYSEETLVVPQGSTSVQVDWNEPAAPIIRGLTPTQDSTYKYILP